jgi:hypothetical protein
VGAKIDPLEAMREFGARLAKDPDPRYRMLLNDTWWMMTYEQVVEAQEAREEAEIAGYRAAGGGRDQDWDRFYEMGLYIPTWDWKKLKKAWPEADWKAVAALVKKNGNFEGGAWERVMDALRRWRWREEHRRHVKPIPRKREAG